MRRASAVPIYSGIALRVLARKNLFDVQFTDRLERRRLIAAVALELADKLVLVIREQPDVELLARMVHEKGTCIGEICLPRPHHYKDGLVSDEIGRAWER